MPFRERSAWLMLLALLLSGGAYFGLIAWLSGAAGALVAPNLPFIMIYTALLVVIAVGGHILIAALGPKDANASIDKRERMIVHRAGHWSAAVLAAGVLLSLGAYLLVHSGDVLFYSIFASLMLGQLVEYALQIALYRWYA